MNKHTLSFIALSAIALLAATTVVAQEPGAPERSRAADEAAVLAVVDSSLAAISAEDFEAFADLMLPEAMAFTVWEQVGELAYRARSREDQRSMDVGDADFLERGFDPARDPRGQCYSARRSLSLAADGDVAPGDALLFAATDPRSAGGSPGSIGAGPGHWQCPARRAS